MRLSSPFLGMFAAALLSGCAHTSPQHSLVLERVGPPGFENGSAEGSLLVFSALKVGMPDNTLAGRQVHHTDYKIFSEEGKLLQSVHNDYDNSWEGPREVALPVGKYRIVAQAAKYGVVTVPVLIAAHQVTRVNLTGTPLDSEKGLAEKANLVCLPDGQIVGSFARDESPMQTLSAKHEQK